ncbi:MAG: DNA ligase [Methanocalculus sp. MSAO_Arc1]|uniref:DNA polymerase ligase N-terminal domain-containing protein n=1 Tax=Methanocalculus TaxID=71151 RepID=UPI000FED9274|nr:MULTISPECIES: DNA polymerase ligase N-terminal domain-containing protein [unclassified Methanocalculus]MCP1662522.1 DNA ligase D-like protein (predicted 3'-phosphoesterase) [Methanocalculus sp. AMF5]RQD79682.1 MAG: DNA ligase [Methanocalculus sp. MSAO_Arc1]
MTDSPLFVIQKHDAQNLHYDLRLEVQGTLRSWVLPKGPSADPAVKRLAMETADHRLEYAAFEGVIPEGEYGAGTVLIWDRGTFENLRLEKDGTDIERSLAEGKVEVFFSGTRMKGGWALIRTGKPSEGRWLFIKMKDEYADRTTRLTDA